MSRIDVADLDSVLPLFKENTSEFDSWTEPSLISEFKNSQVLAFFSGSKLTSVLLFRRPPGIFEVSWIYTMRAWRRQGQAKALIEGLVFKASAENQRVWLEVHQLNTAALGLYRSIGFKQVGKRPSYYKDGGDALLLEFADLPLI